MIDLGFVPRQKTYFNDEGMQYLPVEWTPPDSVMNQHPGEYFAGLDESGNPVFKSQNWDGGIQQYGPAIIAALATMGASLPATVGAGSAGAGALAAGDAMAGLIPAGELGSWTEAAGAAGAGAAGSSGGGMFELGDLTNAWSNAFGESGGWNPLTDGYGMGEAVNASGGGYPWLDASGNLDVDTFLKMTGEGGQYADLIPGGASGIPGMDTLGSTSWLESAVNTLKAQGISPTQALQAAKSALSGGGSSGLLSGLGIGANALGSYLANKAGQDAATKAAAAQIQAAQIAADAAKFKPIGITTRFGESNFIKDAQGNVVGAGYNLAPDMKAQQDKMIGASGTALDQYMAAPGMFAPMGAAGQRAMSLGNQYLATDPQAQAMKYMQDQQALLATGRERDMNQMLSGEFNRGTYGLATGGTSTGMGAANPRLEAMLNAQRQQDLGLAAQATQGGMDYAKFGAALTGTGGDLVRGMFSGQTAAYDPYKTAIGGAQYLEGLGQQPLTMGIDIGKQTSNAAAGGLLAQGITNAAGIQQQAAGSPWANALGMLGGGLQNYQQQQQQQQMMNKIWGV